MKRLDIAIEKYQKAIEEAKKSGSVVTLDPGLDVIDNMPDGEIADMNLGYGDMDEFLSGIISENKNK